MTLCYDHAEFSTEYGYFFVKSLWPQGQCCMEKEHYQPNDFIVGMDCGFTLSPTAKENVWQKLLELNAPIFCTQTLSPGNVWKVESMNLNRILDIILSWWWSIFSASRPLHFAFILKDKLSKASQNWRTSLRYLHFIPTRVRFSLRKSTKSRRTLGIRSILFGIWHHKVKGWPWKTTIDYNAILISRKKSLSKVLMRFWSAAFVLSALGILKWNLR